MVIRYFSVPVDEARAYFLRRRFTADEPAQPFEARMHAAFLVNAGEIQHWSLSDLSAHWGWGEQGKWRVKRVIDHVRNSDNLWTLLDNCSERNASATAPQRDRNGTATAPQHRDLENQALTSDERNASATAPQRDRNGTATLACARGDALIPNTDIGREERSEIREKKEQTPLPPHGGDDDDAHVAPTKRKRASSSADPGVDFPLAFPEELRSRPDVAMLVKLWHDLKNPKGRTNFLEVAQVWSAYRQEFPRARLIGAKEYRYISDRIDEGRVADPPIPVDDFCLVPAGVKRSTYHMGDNPEGKTYTSLISIFRELKRVEDHIARARELEQAPEPEPAKPEPVNTEPQVPIPARAPLSHEDRQIRALLDFAGVRLRMTGMTALEINQWLSELLQRHGPVMVARAIKSWKDDPEEPDDDKSDIKLWLPVKCSRLASTPNSQ